MTKTVIRGAWPGKPTPKHLIMKPIKETYVPPDRHASTRGKSQYKPFIDHLLSGKPGTLAVECTDHKVAKGLGHALSRHLQKAGLYETLRPRIRKDGVDCVKVWVVKQEKIDE